MTKLVQGRAEDHRVSIAFQSLLSKWIDGGFSEVKGRGRRGGVVGVSTAHPIVKGGFTGQCADGLGLCAFGQLGEKLRHSLTQEIKDGEGAGSVSQRGVRGVNGLTWRKEISGAERKGNGEGVRETKTSRDERGFCKWVL